MNTKQLQELVNSDKFKKQYKEREKEMIKEENSIIKESAIVYKWLIYTWRRHNDCIKKAHEATWDKPIKWIQGFVDKFWGFHTRKEAAKIAILYEQIEELSYSKDELYSEDLY